MQQVSSKTATCRGGIGVASDLIASRNAGEDPRRTMARLNACIVGCQSEGLDVPSSLLRLSQRLAADCVAQAANR
jgi:hypothetical protein